MGNGESTIVTANVIHVTDQTFDQEVLQSDVPVLVDFWAEWCGPCRMIAPVVEALAQEYAGRLKVAKLDVDANGSSAMRYQIRGIPTLLLFKDGRVVDMRVGAVPKAELVRMITPHLAPAN
jgi:thioredoxin 1